MSKGKHNIYIFLSKKDNILTSDEQLRSTTMHRQRFAMGELYLSVVMKGLGERSPNTCHFVYKSLSAPLHSRFPCSFERSPRFGSLTWFSPSEYVVETR